MSDIRYLLIANPDANDWSNSDDDILNNPPKSIDSTKYILSYSGANKNYVPAVSGYIEVSSHDIDMITRLPQWLDYTTVSTDEKEGNLRILEDYHMDAASEVVEKVKRHIMLNKATISPMDSIDLINAMQFANWEYAPSVFKTIDLVQLCKTLGAPDFAYQVLLQSTNIPVNTAFPQSLKDEIILDLQIFLKKTGVIPL